MAKTYPWGGFKDGCIPESLLTTVRGELFEREAAGWLTQLEQAFQAHFGYQAVIIQGYRALGSPSDKPGTPTQWGLYNQYHSTDPTRAAYQGTSNHGFARAADFGSGVDQMGSQQKDWMNANAPKFGWHPTGDDFGKYGWKVEPWHFDYIPGTATMAIGQVIAASGVKVSAPNNPSTPKEEDMSAISFVPDAQSATIWMVSGITGNRVGLGSPYHMQVCQRASVNNGGDKMLAAELDYIYRSYLTTLNSGLWAPAQSLPTLDTGKLADAVVTALKAADITVKADPAALAPVLDAAFTRSIAAIAKQTSDETVKAVGFDQAKLSDSITGALVAAGAVNRDADKQVVQAGVSAAISRALAAIAKATAEAPAEGE